jgi:hypothetical protein
MTYYQIDVKNLERANTKEDGAAWRAMDYKAQAAYCVAMKPVLKEFRTVCKREGLQRDFKTEKAATAAITFKFKTRFPELEFVVLELTPVGVF